MPSTRLELFRTLIGFSEAINALRDAIAQLPSRDARVIVEGERGTGHAVVARALHARQADLTSAHECRFVPFNCATTPAELHASELFGYAKGAFPGALAGRRGRLALAMHGTLFIEECGRLAPDVQRSLAKALTAQQFQPVGANKTQSITSLNIVVSDIEGLHARVEREQFDADLFRALGERTVSIPSLKARADDIPLLLTEMAHRAELDGKGAVYFTSAAVAALRRYAWPGNGYELARFFEQSLLSHAGQVVDVEDLPDRFKDSEVPTCARSNPSGPARPNVPASGSVGVTELQSPDIDALFKAGGDGSVDMRQSVSKLESALIHWAIDASDGVVSGAARRLRINRTTLVEKMRKYGISRASANL